MFIAPTILREDVDEANTTVIMEKSFDELTSSPCHVEPYPKRRPSALDAPIPDTPSRRRIEGVYDRFLMATSGVKRLGKGYQSDNAGPVSSTVGYSAGEYKQQRQFHSARRAMKPPVSSEDIRRPTASVDELGMLSRNVPLSSPSAPKDDGNTTVTLVRRAFKAIVPGKTVSRRLSRLN